MSDLAANLRRSAVVAAALLSGCVGTELPPSLWPPQDFVVELEEVRFVDDGVHVLRRFRVDASGVALYGESEQPLLLPGTNVSLPVFDRLAIYRLAPECVRALSRRICRIGSPDLSVDPGVHGTAEIGLVVRWQAFQAREELTGAGRLHGVLAEIVALVAAYLPPGVQLHTQFGRKVVPVLTGVPEVAESGDGALSAYRELREQSGNAPNFLLEGLALACARGARDDADRWLEAWTSATAEQRSRAPAFGDKAAPLQPAQLRELLPPQ
ncbi:MAG: hypothetical protein R3F29_12000 [Planctomycetota bacterium]